MRAKGAGIEATVRLANRRPIVDSRRAPANAGSRGRDADRLRVKH